MLIADFGLSKDEETSRTSNTEVPGMTMYIDPQYFSTHEYKRSKKSDIYSFGIILWEISSGRPPFQTLQTFVIQVQIIHGKREEPIEGTPGPYTQLYQRCWDNDPNLRPTMKEISKELKTLQKEATIKFITNTCNQSTTQAIQNYCDPLDFHNNTNEGN